MHALAARTLAAVVAAAVVAGIGGCGSGDGDRDRDTAGVAAGGPLAVVATTAQVADLARVIGGDRVAVTQLVAAGVDPHDYQPTPTNIEAIRSADVVLKNGLGLEPWLDPAITSAGFAGPVVDASRDVPTRPGGKDYPNGDPHIWHNPLNAKIMLINIDVGLVLADVSSSGALQLNLTAISRKLDQLDAANQEKFAALPADRRVIVTGHDAFGYYADRYRLRVVGSVIPGLKAGTAPSADHIDDLIAKIKSSGTKVVFADSALPQDSVQAVAAQAGVKFVGDEQALYGDGLGRPGTPESTYLGAEQHNTDTIVAALAGSR
jgi:zinc/manganese transport system substrate-binding protein